MSARQHGVLELHEVEGSLDGDNARVLLADLHDGLFVYVSWYPRGPQARREFRFDLAQATAFRDALAVVTSRKAARAELEARFDVDGYGFAVIARDSSLYQVQVAWHIPGPCTSDGLFLTRPAATWLALALTTVLQTAVGSGGMGAEEHPVAGIPDKRTAPASPRAEVGS